jgi:hypothetical protein
MRKVSIALLIALSTFVIPQDEQDPKPDDGGLTDILAPLTAYREEEQIRQEELISGAWRLVQLETPSERLGSRDIRGFAMFQEGYMTLVLMGEQLVEGFLTVEQIQTHFQAGIYRYQVSELQTLQTASIMGFANPDSVNLIFERVDEPREFIMDVSETELRLNHPNGHWLVFTRMKSGAFPIKALLGLERKRAGRNTTPDWNPVEENY